VVIKIDTREQSPYQFETPFKVGTLDIGGYSISGLEKLIAVERKSIGDLIGCLTVERERFEKELHRGRALDYFALVIETTLEDLTNGPYHSQICERNRETPQGNKIKQLWINKDEEWAMAEDKVLAEMQRTRTEVIRATLGEFKGKQRIDIRIYFESAQENWLPTKKGINIAVDAWLKFKAFLREVDQGLK
jgi:DNA excision repair protein ERCC-4